MTARSTSSTPAASRRSGRKTSRGRLGRGPARNTAMPDLSQHVALVTGASRGVGRGVALGLAHAGAKVFATGRSIAQTDLEAGITKIPCDHTDDRAVADV